MGFHIIATVIALTTASNIKLQHASGTVYEQITNAAVYGETVQTTMNIGIPSPRILLDHRAPAYNECNQKYSGNSIGLCDLLFGTFDKEIERFLDLDLVSNVTYRSRATRAIAAIAAVVVGSVIVIATALSGYFIGAAVTNRDMDEFREEQRIFKEQMGLVRKQVNLTNYNLMDVVDSLTDENDPMVLSNDPLVPMEILGEKAMLYGMGREEHTWHITKLNTRETDKFKTNILTLQNNRLPLEEPFLIGMKAQCLALQNQKTEREMKFCTDFAFHSNRWDTSLHFEGIGFSYFDFVFRNHTVIKEVVYSFSINIPILEKPELTQYKIRNLGRFVTQTTLQITLLPNFAIMALNQILKPLDKSQCAQIGKLEICPLSAVLRYDDCLNKNFNGLRSTRCKTEEVNPQSTCISSLGKPFVAVSMTLNSTVLSSTANSQIEKVRNVAAFDIVDRTLIDESISCAKNEIDHFSPVIKIPRLARRTRFNYTVEHVNKDNFQIHRTKSIDHDISEIHQRITIENKDLEISFNSTQNELKNFKIQQNSTLKYMKKNIKQTAENALESTIKFFLPYIISALTGIGILLLLWAILAFGCRAICKNQKKYSGRPIIQPWVQNTTTTQHDEEIV